MRSTDAGSLPPLSIGATILVVEDCLASAEAMRLMARRLGLRVRLARNLESARRHLASFSPALILADVGLPDGSGLDLLRAIASGSGPRPVCLAMSADETRAGEPGLSGFADGFARKPFATVDAFRATLAPFLPAPAAEAGPLAELVPPQADLVQADIDRAREVLAQAVATRDREALSWVGLFLTGLAAETGDQALRQLARTLSAAVDAGGDWQAAAAAVGSACGGAFDASQSACV